MEVKWVPFVFLISDAVPTRPMAPPFRVNCSMKVDTKRPGLRRGPAQRLHSNPTADAELRKIVRRIHRQNPRCKILVTGCYAQRASAELAALDGVHWVVGNSHKQQIRELFQKTKTSPANGLTSSAGFFPLDRLQDRNSDSGDTSVLPETPRAKILVGDIFEQQELMAAPVFGKEKTRPTLKIQDGCNARCSYCIIPYVRGRSRSLRRKKFWSRFEGSSATARRRLCSPASTWAAMGKT